MYFYIQYIYIFSKWSKLWISISTISTYTDFHNVIFVFLSVKHSSTICFYFIPGGLHIVVQVDEIGKISFTLVKKKIANIKVEYETSLPSFTLLPLSQHSHPATYFPWGYFPFRCLFSENPVMRGWKIKNMKRRRKYLYKDGKARGWELELSSGTVRTNGREKRRRKKCVLKGVLNCILVCTLQTLIANIYTDTHLQANGSYVYFV